MRKRNHISSVSGLLLAVFLVFALGCQTDGPEFAGGDTRIVEGTLDDENDRQSDFYVITRAGTVNIQLTSLSVVDAETGEPLEGMSLGVSIGRPDPSDESLCQLTFSQVLLEEESFSVYYQDGIYCLLAFRTPTGPTGTVIDYVITMNGAFS